MFVGFWHITNNPELTALEQWASVRLTTLLSNHSCLTWVGPLVLVGLNHTSLRSLDEGLVGWEGSPLCHLPLQLLSDRHQGSWVGPQEKPWKYMRWAEAWAWKAHATPTGRGFPGCSDAKVSACNAGDPGLIPGSGRSPGEGNGNPLQNSCLENPMDGGAL